MSCLIQKPENTAALADYISKLLNMSYEWSGMEPPAELRSALIERGCVDSYEYFRDDRMYLAMAELNCEAYRGRYGVEDVPFTAPYAPNSVAKRAEWDEGKPDINGFHFSSHYIIEPWHYKIYKMLQFYNYQCTESATLNDGLHLALEKLEASLARFIVMNSETYIEEEWE